MALFCFVLSLYIPSHSTLHAQEKKYQGLILILYASFAWWTFTYCRSILFLTHEPIPPILWVEVILPTWQLRFIWIYMILIASPYGSFVKSNIRWGGINGLWLYWLIGWNKSVFSWWLVEDLHLVLIIHNT